MTIDIAIKILKDHNMWRRGSEKYDPTPPALLGDAIDTVVNHYENLQKEENNIKPSFWFMRDNHTFTKIEGKTIEEIKSNAKKISKENPWGMICPVTISNGKEELRRVGKSCHVDSAGNVDITQWVDEIMKDDVIRSYLTDNNDNVFSGYIIKFAQPTFFGHIFTEESINTKWIEELIKTTNDGEIINYEIDDVGVKVLMKKT